MEYTPIEKRSSIANAKNKTYPIVRPLYFYYIASAEAQTKSFIDYTLSDKGQKIVSEIGFIAVN